MVEISYNRTDSIETIIRKGEEQGFIVLPWRTSKTVIMAKNTWYRNRQKQNKPYIVISLGINGRGTIYVNRDPSDGFGLYGFGGFKMNVKMLVNETREIYESFPKEKAKKMRLKASDIRATYSQNYVFAHFPPGDTFIIECVLRHVKEGSELRRESVK